MNRNYFTRLFRISLIFIVSMVSLPLKAETNDYDEIYIPKDAISDRGPASPDKPPPPPPPSN